MILQDQIDRADHEATELALENGIEALMAGAIDPEIGADVLADLLAHELTAIHRLMMRLTGTTHGVLDWCVTEENAAREAARPAPDTEPVDRAVARLAGVASRLMETMRQGLVALARLRPEAVGEGKWIALSTLDGRCSEEELRRRIAALKAGRAANDPAPRKAAPSPKAQDLRALVDRDALELAAEAGVETMAPLAADQGLGVAFLARLLGHELGTEHGLMMRLAGSANIAYDRATAAHQEPAAALVLSGTVARLADRFRRGMLTLQSLSSGPGGPDKVAGLVWGGANNGGYKPAAPANDALGPATAAGHGVDRSESNQRAASTAGHGVDCSELNQPAASTAGHGVDCLESSRAA
jgi:hypothetical protein